MHNSSPQPHLHFDMEDAVIRAGVAHDIVNAVQAATAHCELALRHVSGVPAADRNVAAARNSADLASSLCIRLMRSSFPKPKAATSINDTISQVLRELAPTTDTVKTSLCASKPIVFGDATQLAQVIRNILMNAIQASGGLAKEIEITSSVVSILEGVTCRGERAENAANGPYARVDIKDHGTGIQPCIIDLIFEPGFSTKTEGSGIGLAAAIAIVRQHRGLIFVNSILGIETTFSILIPSFVPVESHPVDRGSRPVLFK